MPLPLDGTLRDWRAILAGHYLRLSPFSRRRRFLGAAGDRGLRSLAETSAPDAVIGIKVDGEVRGVLEIFDGRDGHAEIGISVEDAYQGRGYGRQLFEAGLAHASRMGIATADLFFARDNAGIRHMVQEAGGEIRVTDGECEAHVRLADCAAGS